MHDYGRVKKKKCNSVKFIEWFFSFYSSDSKRSWHFFKFFFYIIYFFLIKIIHREPALLIRNCHRVCVYIRIIINVDANFYFNSLVSRTTEFVSGNRNISGQIFPHRHRHYNKTRYAIGQQRFLLPGWPLSVD